MTADTDQFSVVEILALTAVGESESLGEQGMTETICTVMNRAKANVHWMGGSDVRAVCLQHAQYDCWNEGSDDRERILSIGVSNPTYGPYTVALGLAARAIADNLPDVTNSAVSYFDSDVCDPPDWSIGKPSCFVSGNRIFYDLAAVA